MICHDCDIPPHPVHPQSRLHAALFALNSPHPNPIHIQTLSPLSSPSHALCSICDAYVSTHDALLFLSVSREHRWPITNTHDQLQITELALRSRATSASYDKSLFSFCIHFGFFSSRFDICTLALPFTFSLLIPGSTHPRHPPLSSIVASYCTRLAFTPGLTASHSRPRI